MYMVLGIILLVILGVCIFLLGGLYTRHILLDALNEARRQRFTEEYYRLSGTRSQSDPRPYIPPTERPKTPRSRYLPYMNKLDRLLREGKRGTIMVRAGDRYRKAG